MEANLLDDRKNNYIMCVYKNGIYFGVTVCDITTGDFRTTEIKETNNFANIIDAEGNAPQQDASEDVQGESGASDSVKQQKIQNK